VHLARGNSPVCSAKPAEIIGNITDKKSGFGRKRFELMQKYMKYLIFFDF
jgi:hypothetical protein